MEQLHMLVTAELPASQHAERVEGLVREIQQNDVTILQLVTALGPYLASEDDAVRTRAINVLAQTVVAAPQVITSSGDVDHLASFFTGRLTDWPAIRGALNGCLALMRLAPGDQHHHPPTGAPPSPSSAASSATGCGLPSKHAVSMMAAFTDHVFVRSLAQQDRHLALSLLSHALEAHGQALLDSQKVDVMEVVIASLDGEKDPRCLLLGLRCVRCAVELYSRQPSTSLHSQKTEDSVDELFDVTSAYFPVAFTPPTNDPHGITRHQLASVLEGTLVCTPLFAPHLLPLVLEKLSSSVKQAKLDSLSALGACALRWGPTPLAGHVSAMWAAIKAEMRVGSVGVGGGGGVEGGGDAEVQAAAERCLSRCLQAFGRQGHWSLLGAVWEDAVVQDLFACLPSSSSGSLRNTAEEAEGVAFASEGGEAFARRVARIRAAARVLSAGCQAGRPTASRLYRLVLPKVLPFCGTASGAKGASDPADSSPDTLESRCLALAVLLTLLQAVGGVEAMDSPQQAQQGGGSPSSGAEDEGALPMLGEAFQAVLHGTAAPMGPDETASTAAGGTSAGAALPTAATGRGEGEQGEEVWVMERRGYTPAVEASLRLRTMHALFELPAATSQLPAKLLGDAVGLLVGCIVGGGGGSGEDPDSGVSDALASAPSANSLARAAGAALAALAAHEEHAELVAQRALPPLVTAATAPSRAAPQSHPFGAQRPAPSSQPLAALESLAGSHPSLGRAVLSHFDLTIQRLLPLALTHPGADGTGLPVGISTGGEGSPGGLPHPTAKLLALLLAAAQRVVVAGGEAAGVSPLAVHLLQAVLEISGPQVSSTAVAADAGLTAACSSLVFHAVRLADESAQHAFLASCPPLQASIQSLKYITPSSSPGSPPPGGAALPHAALRQAACAAVLCGLRPAVLSSPSCAWDAPQLGAAVGALLGVAMAPSAASACVARWTMLAAASLLNKWKPDSAEFHQEVHRLLEQRLLPLTLGTPGATEPDMMTDHDSSSSPQAAISARQAWACLTLVTKGLVMRGHPVGDGVLAGTLSMLQEADLAWRGNSDADLATAWPAAQGGLVVQQAACLFGEVLQAPTGSTPQQDGGVLQGRAAMRAVELPALGPPMHVVVRPLWQQRVYTMQCAALLRALSSPDPAGGGCGGGLGAAPLTLALAHLLRGAPHAVLRSDWQRALPWVVTCLRELPGSCEGRGQGGQGGAGGGVDAELVESLLGTLCEALMEEEGRRLCEGLLPQLVPVLLSLLGSKASPLARERAAQGLLLVVQLPYSSLHTHRAAVLRGLTQALDDDRRVIRQQAAQAKQAWAV